MGLKVHKFGGSSLADAACFRRVADILKARAGDRLVVVVSAMGGMTDKLLRLVAMAERDDSGFTTELNEIGERYSSTRRVRSTSPDRPTPTASIASTT